MKSNRTLNRKRSWFTSKWFLAFLLIVFCLITIALMKEFYRSHQINNEIAQLQKEIQALEGKNNEFSEFVEFLKTDVYVEEQARIKLGMKAPGEKVIVLKEGDTPLTPDGVSASKGDNTKTERHFGKQKNSSKWWNYFWQ